MFHFIGQPILNGQFMNDIFYFNENLTHRKKNHFLTITDNRLISTWILTIISSSYEIDILKKINK